MFSKRSAGKPVLIADVSDGSFAIALAHLKEDSPVQIIRSIRHTLPIEDRTRDQSASAIAKALEESLTTFLAVPADVEKESPEEIHILVRAPWTRFRTAKAGESFAETRVVTKELINDYVAKALAQPSELDAANLLEGGVLQVFLNGYHTNKPLNKKALAVAVVAYQSDIEPTFRTSLSTVFGKLLPGRTPGFHSGMRANLAVMHEYFPHLERFVFLDIGGTTTSCTIVRKDAITQHAVVPEGVSTLVKRVAPTGLPEETLGLLRMLANDTCSTAACQSIKDSLAKAEPELVRAFGEVFASVSSTRRLPNVTILSAPAEVTPWLQGFFSRIDFSQFTATTKPLVIESLSPDHLLAAVRWEAGVTADTGIGIAAGAVNILAHEH
jgi:hypothetical protein